MHSSPPTADPQNTSPHSQGSSFRAQIEQYLRREANPPYKYSHQPRLYALTQQIAAASEPPLAFDDDVVYAAAFFHDLGVFIGHRPEEPALLVQWDHVGYACERTPSLLRNFGFPEEKIPPVLAAIREHQPQDDPGSLEATLLRDADILEQLGAIGILRTATKVGSDTRFHSFRDAQASLLRSLRTLSQQIRLPATHALAAPRIAILQNFLAALDSEANGHLD